MGPGRAGGGRRGRARRAGCGGGAERGGPRAARARRQAWAQSCAQSCRRVAGGSGWVAAALPLLGEASREQPGQSARGRAAGSVHGSASMSEPTLPELLGIERKGPLQAELRLRLPEALLYFRGHFPGGAILPAVVQI